jgi:hypothetical protein
LLLLVCLKCVVQIFGEAIRWLTHSSLRTFSEAVFLTAPLLMM